MSIEHPLHWPDGRFLGVLTDADGHGDVALLLPNAGFIHCSGPFRLHVALARRLAGLGIRTLRVDLPGVGEVLRSADRPQLDIAVELIDRLQAETGCRRFIIGGICSAADLGWRLALRDPRVAGLLLLDPLARNTHPAFRRGQLRLLWQRGPRGWVDIIKRRLAAPTPNPAADDAQLRDWPRPGDEAPQLAELVQRGVELFVLYTGGAAAYMTHPDQFFEGFGSASRDPRVAFQYWPDCDHLFFLPEHRERLLNAIAEWVRPRFGGHG